MKRFTTRDSSFQIVHTMPIEEKYFIRGVTLIEISHSAAINSSVSYLPVNRNAPLQSKCKKWAAFDTCISIRVLNARITGQRS